jgi:hypothetical protein
MNKSFLSLLFFVVGLVLIFTLFLKSGPKKNDQNDTYLNKLILDISGIVTKREYLQHGAFRIFVDVKQSNMITYHPQDSLKHYLCKVDDDKAEFILFDADEYYSIGDSIVVNSKVDSIYSYDTKKKIKIKRKLTIVDYFDY